jgi:hypothetical protein
MLLKEETRQIFVDLHYEAQVCRQFQNDTWDDEFLVARLLFVTTYNTTLDFPKLIEEHKFADTVVKKLAKHAARSAADPDDVPTSPMEAMALIETLRLLYNVTKVSPPTLLSFSSAIPHILTLLCNHDSPLPQKPLEAPVSPIVNSLLNLDLNSDPARPVLFPQEGVSSALEKMINLLEQCLNSYVDAELEMLVTPLVLILTVIYYHAPEHTRQFLKAKLLPADRDREDILGKGDSLPAKLLRNTTNPVAPSFAASVSELFFNMSDNDATKFVQNVGYGFASGFLFQRGIPVPDSVKEGPNVGGEASGSAARAVNPITGQFLDQENAPDAPPMTDEEKQREAERLFVLFER